MKGSENLEIPQNLYTASSVHPEAQEIILALCKTLHGGYKKNQSRIDRVAGMPTFIKERKHKGLDIEDTDIHEDINEKPLYKIILLRKIYTELRKVMHKKHIEGSLRYLVEVPDLIAVNDEFLVQEKKDALYTVAKIHAQPIGNGQCAVAFKGYISHLHTGEVVDRETSNKQELFDIFLEFIKDLFPVIEKLLQEKKLSIIGKDGRTYYGIIDIGAYGETGNIWFERRESGMAVFQIPDIIKIDTRQFNPQQ